MQRQHRAAEVVEFVSRRERLEVLLGREALEVVLGREALEVVLGCEALEVVLGCEALEVVFGREASQLALQLAPKSALRQEAPVHVSLETVDRHGLREAHHSIVACAKTMPCG